MRSEGRGCKAGRLFGCRKKKKKENRPIPKHVGNIGDRRGRGCDFLTGGDRGCDILRKRKKKNKKSET